MRIAALYDIHGNLPALEAVLAEVSEHADAIVVGGDVMPGPMAIEALALLEGLDTPTQFITGNGEADVLAARTGRMPERVPPPVHDVVRWTGAQLSDERAASISAWPATITVDVPELGRILFCHATPTDDNEIFTELTPDAALIPRFESVDADVVVCGHTHMAFDRRVGDTRVVNAGSVGMPFGPPGADWLWIDGDLELRHTSYDLEAAADRIRVTPYPASDGFASTYVLDPPDARTMRDMFEASAVRAP